MKSSTPAPRDRFVGAVLGCAVGDAMGAPFEGLWSTSIPSADELLKGYGEFEGYPRGQYTDDTQLTLATIRAIVASRGFDGYAVASAIAALWTSAEVVGPGGACTRAADAFLQGGDWRSCGAPVGQAGNGTAMRMAALGVQFAADDPLPVSDLVDLARITHLDPRSVAGGVAVVSVGRALARDTGT